MRRAPNLISLLVLAVLWQGTAAADASAGCVRAGERVLASSPGLVMLAPAAGARRDRDVRVVCRRDSGERRTLAASPASCSHCGSAIRRVALRGRLAYAVVSQRTFNDQEAELLTLDTHTWRTRRDTLNLGDQDDYLRSDVTDMIATKHGRVVLRVRNDFAAGIVLASPGGTAWLDEGLATAIGRPRVSGARAVWRHGASLRSSATLLADRCPPAPSPGPQGGSRGVRPGQGRILATADAVTSDAWFCVRATGRVGVVDGSVVRLVGSLAVVQRPGDVRVVDLVSGTTLAGPAASDEHVRSSPGVGPAGTLVLRRPSTCAGAWEIVALAPHAPERRLACGDLRDLRYVDGLVRFRDQATGSIVTAPLR
jgi:hypothetical protein